MAVRLQMKLGVIAEPDRVIDSPDTVVVVEPSVGSVARSKGNLYLIVTSTVPSQRAQEATQLAAETIRSEYYYDESAGIRVCIQKAITSANKRLGHQRERLSLHGDGQDGPIGIGVAVVRGNELYVGTIGPAEAYLIRQARLSTLPDPHRERGLPTSDLEPDVWRGEISVGDSLVLVSPNVMSRLGPDELKDAMVTLHPQPAMEHLHHQFVAADGSASDAMIAIEATEVASTSKARTLVPVRPDEPLAGAPDRGPIPLADNVTDGVAAVQASAFRARVAAGGAFDRLVLKLQDLLPRRRTAYRRVTPASAKRETQRRAAIAVLALVTVAGGLFGVVWAVGGQGQGQELASLTAGQAALRTAQDNLAAVSGPGIDLIRDDRPKALDLLTGAYAALDEAAANGIPAATLKEYREETQAGLDRIYGVVPVEAATIMPFGTPEVRADIGSIILGPGGVPFVLDKATKAVYRIDPATKVGQRVFAEGTSAAGSTQAAPKFMTLGASRDLLIVDEANVLWRWRPADDAGAGTTTRVRVSDNAGWGDDIRAIGTFLRDPSAGLYNFYVVDPSEDQVLVYYPASDGNGFPADSIDRLAVARDLSKVDSLYIDSDIFITDDGTIIRFVDGRAEGWETDELPDSLLREQPRYSLIASASEKRTGVIYAYDRANERVVAIDKGEGTYLEQYRLAGECSGLGGHPGHVRRRRRRGRPGDARLGDQRRPLLVDPRGRSGRRTGVAPAVRFRIGFAGAKLAAHLTGGAGLDRAVIPLRDANPVRRTPIVTIATIVACVVAFAYTQGVESSQGIEGVQELFETYGVVPVELVAAWSSGQFVGPETLAVFTSMFLHVNLIHLVGNLIFLWIFGNNIEDRLGRIWFILFYFVGGIAAVISQVLIDPTSDVPMVGASGAISAVLGAYLVLFPGARILSLVFLGFFYQLIEVPAVIVLGFWFVLQLVDGIASIGLAGAEGGVAFFAHIGGFVAGVAMGLLVRGTLIRRGKLSGLPRPGVG